MSANTSSLFTLLITTIGTAIAVGLGAIVSIATPCILVEQLHKMSSNPPRATHAEATRRPDEYGSGHKNFWDAVLGITLSGSATGYCAASYYFYVWSDSVLTGVLKGTTLVVGSSIGIAVSAALAILAFRLLA